MSKTNDLVTALDDLCTVGKQLVTAGEDLIRIAAYIKLSFSDNEESALLPSSAFAQDSVAEPAQPDVPSETFTKEDVRALLADLSHSGFRAEAKELVRKYSGGGSLTNVDPSRYPELVKEAREYHA